MSRYIILTASLKDRHRLIGNRIVLPIAVLFLLLSLFTVFFVTRGNWSDAISLTLKYYSSWGIVFLLPHVVAATVFLPRATSREEQNHLRGIIFTFAPLAILFPLDLVFFRDHYFKLAYTSFAAFAVIVYFHVSKHFVREYAFSPNVVLAEDVFFSSNDLSPREEQIARLLIKGKTNAEIGEELFISVNTVRSHIKGIYSKLNVSNRVQLMHRVRHFDGDGRTG